MRLTLHYRGVLRANGAPDHKHQLRKLFHAQLKKLWGQPPLSEHTRLLQPRAAEGQYSSLRPLGPFTFVPLVTAEMDAVAELSITLLRPERPGGLLTQGGDIDNRIKTLLDALTMPRHANAIATIGSPESDESPFFCLLEDDNLVVSVAVHTQQLLEPIVDPALVDTTIVVLTRVTRPTLGNMSFA